MDSDLNARKKLESLQGFREMQRDVARVQHEQAQNIANQRQEAVDKQLQTVDESHESARAHMAKDEIISVDALTRIRHFTMHSMEELKAAQNSLGQAQEGLQMAHSELIKKSIDVRVVERLRERQKIVATRIDAQREQNRMDEHAMVRYAREIEQSRD